MTPISSEDYTNVYWATLRGTLDTVLTKPPGSFPCISYEQMYSCVYKCVCRQYGERLYNDLTAHVGQRVEAWKAEMALLDAEQLVVAFDGALTQYLTALVSIVPIFTYLDRFYVRMKLDDQLRDVLLRIFSRTLADHAVPKVLELLEQVSGGLTPFVVSPSVMQSLFKHLAELDSKYLTMRPHLSAKYIPSVHPPMRQEDLDRQRAEDRALQERLRQSGFGPGDQSRKRGHSQDDQEGEEQPQQQAPPAPFQQHQQPVAPMEASSAGQ